MNANGSQLFDFKCGSLNEFILFAESHPLLLWSFPNGNTALHFAVKYGRGDIVDWLLDQVEAMAESSPEAVDLLYITNYAQENIFELSASKHIVELFEHLVLTSHKLGRKLAAKELHHVMATILRHGQVYNFRFINTLYEYYDIARDFVSLSGNALQFVCSYSDCSLEMVQLLLDLRMNVNTISFHQHLPPLHLAINNGNIQLVKFLLRNKADVNYRNPYPGVAYPTAMLLACSQNLDQIARLLYQHGANLNGATELGCFVLFHELGSHFQTFRNQITMNEAKALSELDIFPGFADYDTGVDHIFENLNDDQMRLVFQSEMCIPPLILAKRSTAIYKDYPSDVSVDFFYAILNIGLSIKLSTKQVLLRVLRFACEKNDEQFVRFLLKWESQDGKNIANVIFTAGFARSPFLDWLSRHPVKQEIKQLVLDFIAANEESQLV
jgi:hypothetical protein